MTPEERANAVIGTLGTKMPTVYKEVRSYVLVMIQEAIAEEREACAQVAEALATYEAAHARGFGYGGWQVAAVTAAAAIRARP